jgi:hypothetical protein
MGALDDGDFGAEPVTDLSLIARVRQSLHEDGVRLRLQDAEREAGLADADIWQFAGGR